MLLKNSLQRSNRARSSLISQRYCFEEGLLRPFLLFGPFGWLRYLISRLTFWALQDFGINRRTTRVAVARLQVLADEREVQVSVQEP